MDEAEPTKTDELWRKIGELEALAEPDGYFATRAGRSPEERLQAIWEVLQSVKS